MSHDRCYDHKCRACRKCADERGCPQHPAWSGSPSDCAFCRRDDTEALRREIERLTALVDRERSDHAFAKAGYAEATSRLERAESEVARLKSYIANGVGGAS